jgi:hypothetical protein
VSDQPFSSRRAPRRLSGALAAVLLVGVLAAGCSGDDDDTAAGAGAGATTTTRPVVIGQVETFEVASRNHTDEVQTYPQIPPVGGDHAPIWQNCGFYSTPIFKELGVHSLEHGAVWITYKPDLPADQIAALQALAAQPFTLVTPWDPADGELGAPMWFSAWGAQVAIDTLPNPAADQFLTTYRQSNSAPEPGAPCTGGSDATK